MARHNNGTKFLWDAKFLKYAMVKADVGGSRFYSPAEVIPRRREA